MGEMREYRIRTIGSRGLQKKFEVQFEKIFVRLLKTIGQEFETFEYYKYYKKVKEEESDERGG